MLLSLGKEPLPELIMAPGQKRLLVVLGKNGAAIADEAGDLQLSKDNDVVVLDEPIGRSVVHIPHHVMQALPHSARSARHSTPPAVICCPSDAREQSLKVMVGSEHVPTVPGAKLHHSASGIVAGQERAQSRIDRYHPLLERF